jgi:hypothetical protein
MKETYFRCWCPQIPALGTNRSSIMMTKTVYCCLGCQQRSRLRNNVRDPFYGGYASTLSGSLMSRRAIDCSVSLVTETSLTVVKIDECASLEWPTYGERVSI